MLTVRSIELPPGQGKTTALIEYMLEDGNGDVVLVAPTVGQARHAETMFLEAGGTKEQAKRRFIAAGALLAPGHAYRGARIILDEADAVIGAITTAYVERMAYTTDDVREQWRRAKRRVAEAGSAFDAAKRELAAIESGRVGEL